MTGNQVIMQPIELTSTLIHQYKDHQGGFLKKPAPKFQELSVTERDAGEFHTLDDDINFQNGMPPYCRSKFSGL